MKMNPRIKKRLALIAPEAEAQGRRAFVAGGIVRDMVMGRLSTDLDIVTEGDPGPLVEALAKKWGGDILRHRAFTTYVLSLPDHSHLDFAAAREESYPEPTVLPVVRPSTIDKDLSRRDFTINAMAMELCSEGKDPMTLLDPFDGQGDLKKKLIRALHDKSFEDDPTRIYRAARFAGRLGFRVEEETLGWIKKSVEKNVPDLLSAERRREELLAILSEPKAKEAFDLLRKWDALRFLHPDLTGPFSIKKNLRPLARLGVMIQRWDQDKAQRFLSSIKLSGRDQEAILKALSLVKSIEPERNLSALTKEILGALWGSKSKKLIKKIEQPPLLSGDELKSLGFSPGPGVGNILSGLLKAQFLGKVKTKAQARRFVINMFGSQGT